MNKTDQLWLRRFVAFSPILVYCVGVLYPLIEIVCSGKLNVHHIYAAIIIAIPLLFASCMLAKELNVH